MRETFTSRFGSSFTESFSLLSSWPCCLRSTPFSALLHKLIYYETSALATNSLQFTDPSLLHWRGRAGCMPSTTGSERPPFDDSVRDLRLAFWTRCLDPKLRLNLLPYRDLLQRSLAPLPLLVTPYEGILRSVQDPVTLT